VSAGRRRYYRTIFLGVAAMATLIWAAMDQFGLTREEMTDQFLSTLLAVGVVIGLAAVTVGAWIGLRRLLWRRDDD